MRGHVLIPVITAFLLTIHGFASTVVELSPQDLATQSTLIISGRVGDPKANPVSITVEEVWKAEGVTVTPGQTIKVASYARRAVTRTGEALAGFVPGAHDFTLNSGQTRVLFLEAPQGADLSRPETLVFHIMGLSQGAFTVDRDGNIGQNPSDLNLVHVEKKLKNRKASLHDADSEIEEQPAPRAKHVSEFRNEIMQKVRAAQRH
jgi:hypothetical protein